VATRNSTGWNAGGPKSAGPSGLRRHGITLIMLGAFALIAAGAVSQIGGDHLPMEALLIVGVVVCLIGWRLLVVARHRDHPTD
jgi:cadmium resistance protein CadD (predicted permease)